MEISILRDIVVIFGLSIGVLLACHFLRIPTIVGLLVTGVVSGPHGFGLVTNLNIVEVFSTIGIVLLLFTVGVAFSLARILQFKRYFFLGGGLQVLFTACVGYTVAWFLERPTGEAIFLGFLLSMSSTVIVFRLLETQSEMTTSQGRLASSVLIFQDIILVPVMLFVPVFAGGMHQFQGDVLWLLAEGLALMGAVFILATKIIPQLFRLIAKTHRRELFLFSVLAICFSVAYFAEWLGLSLSIGAFLAGLIISESEYWHQALGDIRSLGDVFTSFFFISVGMLLNIQFVLEYLPRIVLITLAVMSMKVCTMTMAGIIIGVPLRAVLFTSLAICQVGEFSFVLVKAGQKYWIGTEFYYQLFLAVALLSMGLTPFLHMILHRLVEYCMRLPLPTKVKAGLRPRAFAPEEVQMDHIVIIGYGVCGKLLAQSCTTFEIPYLAIEVNSEIVRKEKKKKTPIIFGDASHEIVLQHAHLQHAKAIAISMVDYVGSIRIIRLAKKLNPNIYIISRVRCLTETTACYTHGADDVIADDWGAALQMHPPLFNQFEIAPEDINEVVQNLSDAYPSAL